MASLDSPAVPKPTFCDECGARAATRRVWFVRLVGAIVLFHVSTMEGRLCKSCIHGCFWDYTVITLAFGWWGGISFFLTPFVLLSNIIQYLFCLFMPAVPQTRKARSTKVADAAPAKPAAEQRPFWTAWS
jgi:hypothetical protein